MHDATCLGKFRHVSEHKAKVAMSHSLRAKQEKRMLTVYKCMYCGFWHVGTTFGAKNKKDKMR